MEVKMKPVRDSILFIILILIASPMAILAQTQDNDSSLIVPTNVETMTATAEPYLGAATVNWAFQLSAPYQVQRFDVYSATGTTLKVSIADVDTDGDHWKATVQIWDSRPSTKTTTCSGVAGVYSNPITMNNRNKLPLRARVEVRYHMGNNTWPARGVLNIETNGDSLTVTNLGVSDF
jgi:hypothetical protein